jgi:hypothetical protein
MTPPPAPSSAVQAQTEPALRPMYPDSSGMLGASLIHAC